MLNGVVIVICAVLIVQCVINAADIILMVVTIVGEVAGVKGHYNSCTCCLEVVPGVVIVKWNVIGICVVIVQCVIKLSIAVSIYCR